MSRPSAKSRSAARLAAVQALYELDMSEATPDAVMVDILRERWTAAAAESAREDGIDDTDMVEPDSELFTDLVRGVVSRKAEVDAIADGSLTGGWKSDRLETLLRAVLRAGIYELLAMPGVPPKVVISEYMEVAHAFFNEGEPSLINGVLDRVAHILREGEFGVKKKGVQGDAG
ncbi:MAG: transcription antitermination factor NusB [Rhodospirillales bacterium]|nr:transcription antitermination factor NusB [Rhodospirillales bacterium]MCW8862912.1 transcription antitermination factor NusB [Rhodospirillales bacterium]MCW8951123.1 transcription antitermination factor NusB [Rhodospirillales bacterium]MCW9003464.1 transcription antitermination factor NusB [Rhodospirillales bacterium]MCW9040040.1 transcription antitermination factor NusB [Rhodospirillales bacterium]